MRRGEPADRVGDWGADGRNDRTRCENVGVKRCAKCGEEKPLEVFAKDKRRADGRGSYCKACENARNRERGARLSAAYVPAPTEGERTCSICGVTKPLTEFGRRKDSPAGFRSACNDCKRIADAAAMRRWRERNPDLNLERARQWRAEHPEEERERYRRYDAANREKRRLAIAKSRAENPEHHRELNRKWREANIEISRARCRAYWHRRRSGSDPSAHVDAYAELILLQPCAYCGATDNMSIDHVVPLSRGGTHDVDNLLPACRSCNSSKGNRLLEEWLPMRQAA